MVQSFSTWLTTSRSTPELQIRFKPAQQGMPALAYIKTSTPAEVGISFFDQFYLNSLVPRERIELSRDCSHGILSPARLPIPPPRHMRSQIRQIRGNCTIIKRDI